ncbi:MAG: tetratricopeptide repeat protein [Bacteroidia bacterium]|nr:tetratricopeptide repeat protein [Bacteroidia bacterium]
MNFRRLFTVIVFSTSLMVSCGEKSSGNSEVPGETKKDTASRLAKNFLTDCKALFAKARSMDSVLLNETSVNEQSARKAIEAFTDFAFYCHSDSMSPIYLIKTAQVARAINSIPQAKMALDRCVETYLNSPHRPAALFLLAQLYDEPGYLNDDNEARRLYNQIINEYPKSDWAQSAKGALNFIGKSDEDILKEFEKKNKSSK